MKVIQYLFFLGTVFLFSCSDNSEDLARRYCQCLKENGLEKDSDLDVFAMKINSQANAPCIKDLTREMYETLKPMTNDQRAGFMRNFSKAVLNTECGDMIFEKLPYDEMMNTMERQLRRKNRLNDDFSIPGFSSGPTVCDCVKTGEEMMRAMENPDNDENSYKEIEEKYKDRIEACRRLEQNASPEEKIQMAEEAKNCR